MDTAVDNAIHLHTMSGATIQFRPTEEGLYWYEMPPGKQVKDIRSFLNTMQQLPQNTQKGHEMCLHSAQNAKYNHEPWHT